VVDDRGRFAPPDKLLALVASHVVGRGEKVVTTVDASRVVEEWVERKGGRVVRTKVGDVSVASALRREGGRFGGEPSGAWILPEAHLAPDGPLAALLVLRVLEEEGRRLSELLDEIPSYPLLREKVPCGPGEREERMGRLRERMGELRGISAVEEVDGLRISFEGGELGAGEALGHRALPEGDLRGRDGGGGQEEDEGGPLPPGLRDSAHPPSLPRRLPHHPELFLLPLELLRGVGQQVRTGREIP